jgi:serine protease Do
MHGRIFLVCVCGLLTLPTILWANQDTDLKQALALEKTVQKIIADNEPSIACVLVSRSDLYARFGQGSAADPPGKLGPFDADALRTNALFNELSAADRKKLLKRLDLADPAHVPESSGSGVVIDETGLVLTPYHVVHGATKVFVVLPGGVSSYADVFAADPRSDLAVLRLLRPKLKLRAVRLGDGGKVERGQFIVGLAFPHAPGFRTGKPSAAWGLVSNVQQRATGLGTDEAQFRTIFHYGGLLLTDARVNLGTSGGLLLNLKGEAVAVTDTLAGAAGPDAVGSLALPLDVGLQRILAVLKKGEEVEYGFLGVSFDRQAEKAEGAVLASVTEGSPAEQAGLKDGHIILAVEGQPVHDTDDLLRALATHFAGAKVRLEVRKPSGTAKVDVVLAKYYVPGKVIATEPGERPYFRGLRVDYTSLVVQQPGTTATSIPRGVLITDVQPKSQAAKGDLKAGVIITHVNERAVETPRAFYEIVRDHKGPVRLTLYTTEAGQPAPKVELQ